MNVFHRYTRQALRKNRSRTWVTIVGIILSVALFTAVTEGAYSGVQYLVGAAEYTVGRFHGCYQNLTEQQATQLSRDRKGDHGAVCVAAGGLGAGRGGQCL